MLRATKSSPKETPSINSHLEQVPERLTVSAPNNLLKEDSYMLRMYTMATHKYMLMWMKSRLSSWE
jgi:hypothetical protein